MQTTVIFPYVTVWDALNEITCLSKFYVTGFYCPVLLQYFDASCSICSVHGSLAWSSDLTRTTSLYVHILQRKETAVTCPSCPPLPPGRAEWQNYSMLLKAFKKKIYACYFISNVLFLSVHKLMLVSFILCIELITFDSIFALFLFFLFL